MTDAAGTVARWPLRLQGQRRTRSVGHGRCPRRMGSLASDQARHSRKAWRRTCACSSKALRGFVRRRLDAARGWQPALPCGCGLSRNSKAGNASATPPCGCPSLRSGGAVPLCSGAMVNTTALDCRRYMLTALHCASEVTDEEFTLFKVYFNYERPECGDGNGLLNRRRTGVLRLADSDDIQGSNFQGSDFLLVEIEDAIPTSWPVYYAGWDASGSGSGAGVGIHHPSGDTKKISTFTQNTSSISLGAFGSHWRVSWVDTETDHGGHRTRLVGLSSVQ